MLNERAIAAQLLAPVLRSQGVLNLPEQSDKHLNYALVAEMCLGTLRLQPRLNSLLNQLVRKPLKNKDADIKALLLLGLYQLLHMRAPQHAVINETVAASHQLNKGWAKGLINGALRNFLRDQDKLTAACADDICYQTAHPEWLARKIQHHWQSQAEDIFNAANQRAPMTLRVNRLRVSRDDYLQQLEAADIKATACDVSASGIRLAESANVHQLPGFFEGLVSVQDESAQLCAQLLELKDGQRVLDACAAPGGKTGHLLETNPNIDLLALELDESRSQRIGDNMQRLGLKPTICVADANKLDDWWDGVPFQRILLDAPCSGTGVIRRHPDIKLTRRSEDIAGFSQQQLAILLSCWQTLEPEGLLLYATCSILPQENEKTVLKFLQKVDNAKVEQISGFGISGQVGVQMLPTEAGPDGFYYALLRKI